MNFSHTIVSCLILIFVSVFSIEQQESEYQHITAKTKIESRNNTSFYYMSSTGTIIEEKDSTQWINLAVNKTYKVSPETSLLGVTIVKPTLLQPAVPTNEIHH